MAITDFNKVKELAVTEVSGTPTISKTQCLKITSGDDSTTGTGEIVLDWTNISSQADIGVYDENDNLLDYHFESFDATNEKAVVWVYRDWVRDGSTQLKIAYGNGPTDQSVSASTVFDKETNLEAGYLFNESSGDLLDVTSNNRDGTVSGDVTQGVIGQVDGAYDFNNTDGRIDVANNIPFSGSWSITAWFQLGSGHDGDQDTFFTDDVFIDSGATANNGGSTIWMKGDSTGLTNTFHCILPDGSGNRLQLEGNQYNPGVWVRATLIFDNSTGDAFLRQNGTQVASGNTPYSFSDNPIQIGAGNFKGSKTDWFGGITDNVFVYSTNISSDFDDADYAATKSSPDFFSQQTGDTIGEVEIGSVRYTMVAVVQTTNGVLQTTK